MGRPGQGKAVGATGADTAIAAIGRTGGEDKEIRRKKGATF